MANTKYRPPRDPRLIAKRLRDEVNRFDQTHPKWQEEAGGLITATAEAIGFLEAFAALAAFAEGNALEGPDG